MLVNVKMLVYLLSSSLLGSMAALCSSVCEFYTLLFGVCQCPTAACAGKFFIAACGESAF